MSVPTPHIGASLGEIAPFVLMPGDPFEPNGSQKPIWKTRSATTGERDARIYRHLPGEKGLCSGEWHGDALHGDLFL